MIERQHLSIIRELDRHGSLAAAAEQLNVTQSALSHAIRKLEGRIGAPLWQKEGRRLRLTQAGRYLLNSANLLLPQLEQADLALRQFAQGRKGMLRMGMECHPCYEWLMTVVAPFLKKWPDVDVDVKQAFRFDGLAALRDHNIDILITSDPIRSDDLINTPVLDYELLLVVSRNHALARANSVKAAGLRDENLITFPVERARLDVFTHFLIPAQMEPASQQRVETIEVMLQLVASGRGVCTLPDWLVEKYRSQHPVKGLHLGRDGVHKQLYLIHRRDDGELDYLRDFLALSRDASAAIPPTVIQ